MTDRSHQEISENLKPFYALGTRLIEADLEKAFGTLGDVTRIYADGCDGEESEVIAWTILGGVTIDRETLPVSGLVEDGTDEEGSIQFRQEIILAILAAYVAGQENAGRAA